MRFKVIKAGFDGISGGQSTYETIGDVLKEISFHKGWGSVKQLHAAIRNGQKRPFLEASSRRKLQRLSRSQLIATREKTTSATIATMKDSTTVTWTPLKAATLSKR